MDLLGYLVTALALVPSITQIRHSLRLRSVSGLSGATTFAWVCSWTVWVLYGALVDSGPVVARNLLGLLPAAVLLIVFLRFSRISFALPIVGLYATAAVAMLVEMRWGLLVMVVLDVYFYMPSVAKVFRDRDLSGVSLTANMSQIALTATWLAYLVVTGSVLAGVGWAVATATYATITFRLLLLRRRGNVSPAVASGSPA